MRSTPKMGGLEWLLLIILSIVWGGSFFFSQIALAQVPPFTLVLFRVSIAAIALFIYLRISGKGIPTKPAIWAMFLVMGFINNVIPFSLLNYGQTQIASSLASILNATTPIFTIIVAHILTKDERINKQKLIGILLGFIGVIIMLDITQSTGNSNPPIAMLACIGAAISYGIAAVFGRRFQRTEIGPVRVAFGQLAASTLWMIPIVLIVDPFPVLSNYSLLTIASMVTLGIVCTAFAYFLYFRILSAGGATNISLVTLLVPVSAILLGTIILNEQLSLNNYLGMAFIAFGLLVIDGRLFRR